MTTDQLSNDSPAYPETLPNSRKKMRSFSASDVESAMLDALATYHGFSRSAVLTSLVKKEFWRVFPSGTDCIKPDNHARIRE